MPHEDPDTQLMIKLASQHIKKMRTELKLTQPELAELLSFESNRPVDVKTVLRWEKGESKVPGWVFFHIELLKEENDRLVKEELTKGSIMRHKDSLMQAVIKKARALLKGDS